MGEVTELPLLTIFRLKADSDFVSFRRISLLSWSLRLYQRGTHAFSLIGGGLGNVENGYLGTWQNALPDTPYELRLTLRDSLMRKHEGRIVY